MPDLDRKATVARIVTEHPAAARVFQKHGIDYSCRGNVTVVEACLDARLDPQTVFADLEATLAASDARPEENACTLSTPALIARIIYRHHAYVRRALSYVARTMGKVAKVHGPRDANVKDLEDTM